ncbi:MAG: helix-turn-helix domain-containing protein [Christensenellales bacterium]|jgi:transcriptional regulator with XRE-family HTH domain
MGQIAELTGKRIRGYRHKAGISQDELAERADLHPTYIGQLERGEKNATIETIAKIAVSLDISLEQLLEKMVIPNDQKEKNRLPLLCYELISRMSTSEQEMIYELIKGIIKFKEI